MRSQNITTTEKPGRRSYDDACGAAHALDLVGERWALLVIRELMFGAKRFSDLRADLPGISANVLTQRLEGLESAGVLVRRRLPPPLSARVYELTPWGYEAEPIFQALGRWATRSPSHDPTLNFSAVSLLLSFRTMIDRTRAKGLEARIGLRVGDETFNIRLSAGDLTAERGPLDNPDATFIAAASVMAAAVYGGVALVDLEKQGALKLEGNRALAERFLKLFPLPSKIDATLDSGAR